MGRPVAEHFNPKGLPKRGWPTDLEAKRALVKDGLAMHLYRCTVCEQIHGSSIRTQNQPRRIDERRVILSKWASEVARADAREIMEREKAERSAARHAANPGGGPRTVSLLQERAAAGEGLTAEEVAALADAVGKIVAALQQKVALRKGQREAIATLSVKYERLRAIVGDSGFLSAIRQHVGPGLRPKVGHATMEEARAAAVFVNKAHPSDPPIGPYLCPECSLWHNGRAPLRLTDAG